MKTAVYESITTPGRYNAPCRWLGMAPLSTGSFAGAMAAQEGAGRRRGGLQEGLSGGRGREGPGDRGQMAVAQLGVRPRVRDDVIGGPADGEPPVRCEGLVHEVPAQQLPHLHPRRARLIIRLGRNPMPFTAIRWSTFLLAGTREPSSPHRSILPHALRSPRPSSAVQVFVAALRLQMLPVSSAPGPCHNASQSAHAAHKICDGRDVDP